MNAIFRAGWASCAAVLAQKIMEEHAAGRVQIPHRSGIGTTIQSLANWIGVTPTSKFAIQ